MRPVRTQYGHQVGPFGRFLACPGYPECKFTKPLVVEMPGRCPKCGGRILKRPAATAIPTTAATSSPACDFMTWDVPVKDDCPVCGKTMFKKAGRGFNKPFCANPECANSCRRIKGLPPPQACRGRSGGGGAAGRLPPRRRKKPAAKKTAAKRRRLKDDSAEACGERRRPKSPPCVKPPEIRRKHEPSHCDRRGPGRRGMRLTAGPAGHPVVLREMKPGRRPPAHVTPYFASCAAQFFAWRAAGKRRGPFEGGAAAAGQSDPPLRRCHGCARRRCAGGGS